MLVTIDEMLSKRNVSRYWLSKTINYHYNSLVRLCNNQTTSIDISIIERICIALNCTPNDILLVERNTK